jgi:hypothetical protein
MIRACPLAEQVQSTAMRFSGARRVVAPVE